MMQKTCIPPMFGWIFTKNSPKMDSKGAILDCTDKQSILVGDGFGCFI